jgi:hypothetical protein
MYKSATKCNETIGKWCKNKHGASKIIDTFETYQVAKDLSCLSGEALREQQARLNQLLSEATKQQEAFKKANPGAGASQYIASVGGAGARSRGEASSPHPSARRAGSVTSGRRDKQIQVYDPAIPESKR